MAETEGHLREHGGAIKSTLLAREYQPAAVRAVEIPEASGIHFHRGTMAIRHATNLLLDGPLSALLRFSRADCR